jgi:hypothetical protein
VTVEPVEPVRGGDPDEPLVILQEIRDEAVGETFANREVVEGDVLGRRLDRRRHQTGNQHGDHGDEQYATRV